MPASHRSPNLVQPMPTMATRSFIPPISFASLLISSVIVTYVFCARILHVGFSRHACRPSRRSRIRRPLHHVASDIRKVLVCGRRGSDGIHTSRIVPPRTVMSIPIREASRAPRLQYFPEVKAITMDPAALQLVAALILLLPLVESPHAFALALTYSPLLVLFHRRVGLLLDPAWVDDRMEGDDDIWMLSEPRWPRIILGDIPPKAKQRERSVPTSEAAR